MRNPVPQVFFTEFGNSSSIRKQRSLFKGA
ncbi:MAG: hypothetical protein AAFY16_12200 [Cyanobacteria bacterium J06642_3]